MFDKIINPVTMQEYSVNSDEGKQILKQLVREFNKQKGGSGIITKMKRKMKKIKDACIRNKYNLEEHHSCFLDDDCDSKLCNNEGGVCVPKNKSKLCGRGQSVLGLNQFNAHKEIYNNCLSPNRNLDTCKHIRPWSVSSENKKDSDLVLRYYPNYFDDKDINEQEKKYINRYNKIYDKKNKPGFGRRLINGLRRGWWKGIRGTDKLTNATIDKVSRFVQHPAGAVSSGIGLGLLGAYMQGESEERKKRGKR